MIRLSNSSASVVATVFISVSTFNEQPTIHTKENSMRGINTHTLGLFESIPIILVPYYYTINRICEVISQKPTKCLCSHNISCCMNISTGY